MNFPANQWALDLETLDTKPTAAVLSIGLAKFDPAASQIVKVIDLIVNWKEQVDEFGRTTSDSTLAWWAEQSEEARKVLELSENSEESVHEMLLMLGEMLGPKPVIWGNGSSFDNVILRSLFDSYGVRAPWSFKDDMDMRTICRLEPFIREMIPKATQKMIGAEVVREGTHHNAADDAVYQARVIMRIQRMMNIR